MKRPMNYIVASKTQKPQYKDCPLHLIGYVFHCVFIEMTTKFLAGNERFPLVWEMQL